MTAKGIKEKQAEVSAKKLNSDKKSKLESPFLILRYSNPPRFDTENYFYYTEVFKEFVGED